jgi:Ca2+-binding EF-hand superfamily protein
MLPFTKLCPLLNPSMIVGGSTRWAMDRQKVTRHAGLDLNNDGKVDMEDFKLAASGIVEDMANSSATNVEKISQDFKVAASGIVEDMADSSAKNVEKISQDFKQAASGIVEAMDVDGDGNIDLHDVQQLTQGAVGQVRRKGLCTLIRELPLSAKITIVRRCVKSVIVDHPGGLRGKVQGARRLLFLVFGNIKQADASKMLLTDDDAKIVEIIVEVVGNDFSKTATARQLDVTGDGRFDAEDVTKMLKEAMDADGDGQVDASDALATMNQWFGGLRSKDERPQAG